MDIHEANYQGGSNGTLVSEDGVLEVTIPAWGTGWAGSLWFQPYLESQSHSLVPAYQYYYTLISTVEEIQSDDLDELDIVQPASSFRMRFDNSLLPENAEEWQVVVAYWNWDAQTNPASMKVCGKSGVSPTTTATLKTESLTSSGHPIGMSLT